MCAGGGLHYSVLLLPYCCLIACGLRVCATRVNKGRPAARDQNASRLVEKQLASTKPTYSKAAGLQRHASQNAVYNATRPRAHTPRETKTDTHPHTGTVGRCMLSVV